MADRINPVDRDTVIAAILAMDTKSSADAKSRVEMFGEVLKELRAAGGSMKVWQDATPPGAKKVVE